jgi:hypothetical protein
MADILNLLKSSGVSTERTATQVFGLAVEDFAAKPLTKLLTGSNGTNPAPVNRNDGSWYATSFAASAANSQFRPKLKFLFRVEFLFKPEVLAQFAAQSAAWKNNFTFMIKSVERPKVEFEYEDINAYNFRSKVLKSIKHRELTMAFIDDVGNNVHEFFRFMMMVHSPITRRSVNASQEIADAYATYSAGNGMIFSDNLGNTQDFAHRGVINSDIGNAIQAIKVTQIFMQPGTSPHDLDTGAKEVSFFFINPRIVSFDLDEVNHESNEANLFSMVFDYDFMVMSDARVLQPLPPEKSMPPVGSAPGESQPTGRASGTAGNPAGNNNPYTSLLSSIGARAAQKLTSSTVGNLLNRVPGLGTVADAVSSSAQGFARGQLDSAGSSISGIVQGIKNSSTNAFQSFARPSRDVVVDASTAGRDASSYSTSTGGFGVNQATVDNTDPPIA